MWDHVVIKLVRCVVVVGLELKMKHPTQDLHSEPVGFAEKMGNPERPGKGIFVTKKNVHSGFIWIYSSPCPKILHYIFFTI